MKLFIQCWSLVVYNRGIYLAQEIGKSKMGSRAIGTAIRDLITKMLMTFVRIADPSCSKIDTCPAVQRYHGVGVLVLCHVMTAVLGPKSNRNKYCVPYLVLYKRRLPYDCTCRYSLYELFHEPKGGNLYHTRSSN